MAFRDSLQVSLDLFLFFGNRRNFETLSSHRDEGFSALGMSGWGVLFNFVFRVEVRSLWCAGPEVWSKVGSEMNAFNIFLVPSAGILKAGA